MESWLNGEALVYMYNAVASRPVLTTQTNQINKMLANETILPYGSWEGGGLK